MFLGEAGHALDKNRLALDILAVASSSTL